MSDLRYDLLTLSKYSIGLTFAYIVGYVVNIGHDLWLISFAQRTKSGVTVPDAEISRMDQFGEMISYAILGLCVVTFLTNALWIYRSSWNAREIQPDPKRISPAWSIGFYLIPVVNLFKPLTAMKQTWNSSHEPTADINRKAPVFMEVWWTLWIVGPITSRVSTRMFQRAETPEEYQRAAIVDAVLTVVLIIDAVLFIKIIRAVTTAQQGRVPTELGINPTEGVSS